MTEIEMTTEAETEDFAGDLCDEALDRAGGAAACPWCASNPACVLPAGSR